MTVAINSEGRGLLTIDITGVASTDNGGIGALLNPEGADLMLLRGTLYVIAGSTGSANVGIGVAANATTKGTDVLNDLDCQNLAGKVYNAFAMENTAKTEASDAPVIWQDDYYLTFTGSATTAGLSARLYLEYVRL
jgi:hypothetical protein